MEKGHLAEVHLMVDDIKVNSQVGDTFRQNPCISFHFLKFIRHLRKDVGIRILHADRQTVVRHVKEIGRCVLCIVMTNVHHIRFAAKAEELVVRQIFIRFSYMMKWFMQP